MTELSTYRGLIKYALIYVICQVHQSYKHQVLQGKYSQNYIIFKFSVICFPHEIL